MNKIIYNPSLFTLQQQIFAFKDGQEVGHISCSVDEVKNAIISLVRKYDITTVKLMGSGHYSKKLKRDLQTEALDKYNLSLEII